MIIVDMKRQSVGVNRSVRLVQSVGDRTVISWWISEKQKLRIPCVVFELGSTSPELAVVPSRGIS